ncbi:MAG: transglycosylase SLT domain-containing protein [Rhodobacteraceae bacterium]|nr:transglycosylase SLT domain-containing protein [Paracoccaceae bacterium]
MSVVKRVLQASALAVIVGTAAAWANEPTPFPEFSAKRIKPPAPGTSKRITVQIDPAEQAAAAPPPREGAEDAPIIASPGRYDWFWEEVSPELTSSRPGRLEDALKAIRASGAVSVPRLQHLQEIASAQGIPILTATVGTEVSPALVLAVIAVESAGKSDAVSTAGAEGLMQLMPATAERFGASDSLLPRENISGGVKYLNWLMQEFDKDPILVLAGYNAGEGSVREHSGVPPFSETRDYVPKVLAAFDVAKGLCATPPELITDGCVFVTLQN